MANFQKAFELIIVNEGDYVNDPNDSGGETYRGISRVNFPKWDGWVVIDLFKVHSSFPSTLNSNNELQNKVRQFYETQFWNRISGSLISDQSVAMSIFDFAVNAGVGTSAKLAQKVAGVDDDGVIGSNSIKAINQTDPKLFIYKFAIKKIARYIELCEKNPKNRTFFLGWIKRSIKNLL